MGGLALLLALAACAPEQTGPATGGGLLPPPGPPAQGGQQTNGGALVGSWQAQTVILLSGDAQTTTTVWRFAADATCHRSMTTVLVSEDIPRTTETDCTYEQGINAITVTFPGALPATFSVSFDAFSPDHLVLDGLEYQRVE